jgi:hypothetical protein
MLLFSHFSSTIKAMRRMKSHLSKTLSRRYEMRICLLPAVVVIALVSCAPTQSGIREELNQSISQYNDLVRWHKLDAAGVFPADAISEEFRTRAKAAKNVRIVDYRVVRMNYDTQGNEAVVQVEIDYYTLTENRLRSLIDSQKWAYVTENGIKQWKLMSLLPEFP